METEQEVDQEEESEDQEDDAGSYRIAKSQYSMSVDNSTYWSSQYLSTYLDYYYGSCDRK